MKGKKIENIYFKKKIGKGCFATVYEGIFTNENNQDIKVAIKIMKEEEVKILRDEIKIMEKINHPNILKFIKEFKYKSKKCIVTELCELGTLSDYLKSNLKNNKHITENDYIDIFTQIVNGLKILHQNNIVHRDLKLENIFINKDFSVKIGDFGFARTIEKNQLLNSIIGTPIYMAPEIVFKKRNKTQYDSKCDIWALGIILLELLFGFSIFNEVSNNKELYKRLKDIQENNILPSFNEISSECKHLIQRMLNKYPDKRINIYEIKQHPWLLKSKFSKENILKSIYIDKTNNEKKILFNLSIELIYKCIIELNIILNDTILIINKIQNIIDYLILVNNKEEQDLIFCLYLKMADLIQKSVIKDDLKSNLPKYLNNLITKIIKNNTKFIEEETFLKNKLERIINYIRENKFMNSNIKSYQTKLLYKYIKFIEKTILNEVEIIKTQKNKNLILNNYKICLEIKDVINYNINNIKINFNIQYNTTIKKSILINYIENNYKLITNYFDTNKLINIKHQDELKIWKVDSIKFFYDKNVNKIFESIEIALNFRIKKLENN